MSVSHERPFIYRTDQSTRVNGAQIQTCVKAVAFRSGPTAVSMKATGRIIKQIFMAVCSTKMAIFIKGAGSMTKPMVLVSTTIKTVHSIGDTGLTTARMAEVLNAGQMAVALRVSMMKASSKVRVNSYGQTGTGIAGNSYRTIFRVKVSVASASS